MNAMIEAIVTIALAVVGLAVVSTLVSKNAQTSSVIQAGGSAFANGLAVAQSPVTGSKLNISLGYPTGNSMNYGFGQ